MITEERIDNEASQEPTDRYCPILIMGGNAGAEVFCLGTNCAWWIHRDECCAITALARAAR